VRLDDWYQHWPPDADLPRRFADDDSAQHYGAFWELYLHESLRLAGFAVTRERPIAGTDHRPDFLLTKGARSILFEATTAFPGTVEERKRVIFEGAVYDEFDKTECNHWLGVDFLVAGKASPPVNKMRRQLEDTLAEARDREIVWEWRRPDSDWWVRVEAVPRHLPPRRDGQTPIRPCGVFPPSDASLDERSAPIEGALRRKRKHYGRPDVPFVIGLLPELSVHAALDLAPRRCTEVSAPIAAFFASERNEHVSAVVTAALLKPWQLAKRFPLVWRNPNARLPIDVLELPWPDCRHDVSSDEEEAHMASRFFDLPPMWPGPEPPFPED
jgi:hypothetical protein